MADVELNKEKIKFYIRLVEGALGSDFIEKIKASEAISRTDSPFGGRKEQVHPFFLWWSMIQADLLTYVKTKKLSRHSLSFITLAIILESISHVKGITRLLEGLREPTKFLSTFYEAYIASEYIHSGYEVEVIEECPKEKVKTCDLKVSKSSETMFIECKNIDNIDHIESSKWQHFSSNILNLLQKNKETWKVAIYPSDLVTHDDLELLRAAIRDAIKANLPCEGEVNGKVHYKLLEVVGWREKKLQALFEIDEVLMAQQKFINTVALKDYDSNIENQKNLEPTSYYEVWVAPFEYIPPSKTIINAFKAAKKQRL